MNTKKTSGLLFPRFLKENWAILLIMVFLFCQRVVTMMHYGIDYNLGSDDLAYIQSGITFAKDHIISMWGPYPSAQIMPGTPVLFGLLYIMLGEGTALWIGTKLLYFFFAALTVFYVYKTVQLYAPKWCSIIAVLPFLRTDFSWMNNTLLTETPYLLAFTATVFYSAKYARDKSSKDFYFSVLAFMLGFMFRGNILPFPIFFFGYLLLLKHDRKDILKKAIIFICILLIFIVPWSIRNYIHFDAFIPVSYGSGHPMLLGTFQGINFPPESTPEGQQVYEPGRTLVDIATHAKYFPVPEYPYIDYEAFLLQQVDHYRDLCFNENLELLPEYNVYFGNELCGNIAKLRMKTWVQYAPGSFLYSYLYLKPKYMVNSVFYWGEYMGTATDILTQLPYIENLVLLVLTIILLIKKRSNKSAFFYPLIVFIGNILLYSIGFSFERYAASVISAKYIALGIGIGLVAELITQTIRNLRKKQISVS